MHNDTVNNLDRIELKIKLKLIKNINIKILVKFYEQK